MKFDKELLNVFFLLTGSHTKMSAAVETAAADWG